LDYDWKVHPVIHLDMGSCAGETLEETKTAICQRLETEARENGTVLKGETLGVQLTNLIEELSPRGKVVILVDEYDKPLLGHLGQASAHPIQRMLKGFYGVIKTTEAHQRFALITGVSKFSKVSIFSDLNNLTDLTMDRRAATLLGYTQEELESNFAEYIDALADERGESREATLAELKKWYNGYCFHHDSPRVYNPVSTMKCLGSREFKNYWFETGTPTFLVNLLKKKPLDLEDLNAPETAFSTYDIENLSALPLLVQTGYLTLGGTEQLGEETWYELDFPNFEIENSFSYHLAKDFGEVEVSDMSHALRNIYKALQEGHIEVVLDELRVFFANIPYDITLKNEKYYQTIFYVVFKLIGAMVEAEVRTHRGRIDAVVCTRTQVFVIEFKLHGTATEALAQVKKHEYALKYASDPRPVVLVGVGFDQETRNIGEWLIEG